VLLDAAQSLSHLPIDVKKLDVDFLAASSHKAFGPSGVGFLYAKRERSRAFPLYQVGGGMVALNEDIGVGEFVPRDAPFRFEAGTPAIEATIGFGAAIRWMRAIGMDAIRAHDTRLARYLSRALRELPAVRVLAAMCRPTAHRARDVRRRRAGHDAGERRARALRHVRRLRLGRLPLRPRPSRAREARRDRAREPARLQHDRAEIDRLVVEGGARDRAAQSKRAAIRAHGGSTSLSHGYSIRAIRARRRSFTDRVLAWSASLFTLMRELETAVCLRAGPHVQVHSHTPRCKLVTRAP
jgi:selenocysteine lyase/cysteine desulfurase